MADLQKEIEKVLSNVHEKKVFNSAAEFYEFLKTQGMTITLDEVKNLLIDMRNAKVELNFDEMEEVAGGGQIEIINNVKNNKKPVTIGSVVVVGM